MSFVEELLSRHRQLNSEIGKDATKAQDLIAGVAKKKRAIEALEELIRIEGGQVPEEPQSVVAFPSSTRVSTPITDAAYGILGERRAPMHYHQLAREVQALDVPLGGRNPANTLLAHLSRDSRFYRPGRGIYALREWDPKARSVGVRHKRGA